MTERITNSRLASFRACPRRHQLRYELALAPEQDEIALRVGTAFHDAKEAIDIGGDPWEAITKRGTLEPHDAGMVAAMVTVHGERWAGDTLEVVAAELSFDLPLRNPDTGAATPVWRIAGKIDRIYRLPSGILAVQDYKTTTDDITPGSDFWLRLSLDQQMSIYVLAARELGHDVQTILYDVTKRPLLRPYRKTPDDAIKLTKDGRPYANTRMADETPHEFTVRVAEAMRAEPDKYFARHEFARLDHDLDETRYDIWTQQLAIREAQRSGRWFRNPSSCISPYRCAFLSICGQKHTNQTLIPQGFQRLENVHPELTTPTSGGKPAQASAEQAAHPDGV